MGIPSYFSHIIRKYSKIIDNLDYHKKENTNFNNLFMDCNSIIYDIIRSIDFDESNFEDIIIQEVIKKIEDYIQEIKPSDHIFIAFDGVAPLAKMNQQKTRRYKSSFMSTIDFYHQEKSKWSTSNITPGTKFMNNLSLKINHYFYNKESYYNVKKVLVSCSDEKGEGEHKLFEYIRKNPNSTHNMALYGLDADLIMLSIFHIEYQNNIYIFREAPVFFKSSENQQELLVLNIKYLCNCINSELSCQYPNSKRVYDYTFMCFLLGNDFLPHFPALNIRTHGIEVLIEFYNSVIGNYPNRLLVDNNKIQWRWLSTFIKEIAKSEYKFINEEFFVRSKQDKKYWVLDTDNDREFAFNSIPVIFRNVEKYILPNEKHWEKRYYFSLFKNDYKDSNFIRDLCNNYIEGLEWVLNYYVGLNPSWKWIYNYHYTPLLKDLQHFIPQFDCTFMDKYDDSFSPYLQLVYVLPYSQYNLLPKNISDYIVKNYPEILSKNCEFQWAFCRYFWECHVEFIDISVDKLNKIDYEISKLV